MAIDTQLKRLSALSYRSKLRPLGIPDGNISAADRAIVKGYWAGVFQATIISTFINIVQEIGRTIVQKIAFAPTETRKDVE